MDYLVDLCKDSEKDKKDDVLLKVKRAKNYINTHKNDITVENCEQLRLELEECADKNNLERHKSFPIPHTQNENLKNNTTVDDKGKVDSKVCAVM